MFTLHEGLPDEKAVIENALKREINTREDFEHVAMVLCRVFVSFDETIRQTIQAIFISRLFSQDRQPISLQELADTLKRINQFCTEARAYKERLDKASLRRIQSAVLKQLTCSVLSLYAAWQCYSRCDFSSNIIYLNITSYILASLSAINLILAIYLPISSWRENIRHEQYMTDSELRSNFVMPCEESHRYVKKLKQTLTFAKLNGLLPEEPALKVITDGKAVQPAYNLLGMVA